MRNSHLFPVYRTVPSTAFNIILDAIQLVDEILLVVR